MWEAFDNGRSTKLGRRPLQCKLGLGSTVGGTSWRTVIDGVLEIGIFCQSTCRFLKHLVKFRNWGSKVPLNFYEPISKTPSMTVRPVSRMGVLASAQWACGRASAPRGVCCLFNFIYALEG